MARTIPAQIYSKTASPGEHEIFQRLRTDPQTKDWIVLHSLDIVNHQRQIYGEIDFVVIVPFLGVLCIEVKACKHLRRDKGLWFYGQQQTGDPRGPFKQAAEGMHSIRKRLVATNPTLSRVVFWSAVIFPYVEFSASSPEWHPWQVIDCKKYDNNPIGQLVIDVLSKARALLASRKSATWFNPSAKEPNLIQTEAIAQALRPDFEFFEPPKLREKRQSQELKRFTEEQFLALDSMSSNPRTAFIGPAGTGKTLLAIEAARRSAGTGKRVLFLCFNRQLGKFLEDQTTNLSAQVTTRTLHRHMLEVSGQTIKGTPPALFWETELPNLAIARLKDNGSVNFIFDELVIDEGQDILRDEYLDFLDISLRGGIAKGFFRIFGDFEKQAIYAASDVDVDEIYARRLGHVPKYSLRINCRNTPRIAEFVHLLGDLNPSYSRILRPDDQNEPVLHFYKDSSHQQKLLVEAIQKLNRDGYSNKEITILSSKSDNNCIAATLDGSWRNKVKPLASNSNSPTTCFCSIHSFKGLESPAIVVTDIQTMNSYDSTALFYIAITRALHRLIILADESVKAEVLNVVLSKRSTSPRK